MKAPAIPKFPTWLQNRTAVCEHAEELWAKLAREKNPAQAQNALTQLITNPLMQQVWDELYRKDRKNPGGFMNPARLTNKSQAAAYREAAIDLREKGGEKNNEHAKGLEFEAWVIERLSTEDGVYSESSEQDRAARSFLTRAYRIALDHEPTVLSDVRQKTKRLEDIATRLRSIAEQLRTAAKDLASVGEILFPYYAERLEVEAYTEKLDQIAADCLDDATVMQPGADEPGIIIRKRGDVQLRTIVGKIAGVTYALFMKSMYGTIANLTNVICAVEHVGLDLNRGESKFVTREDVIEMLGDYPPELRPSFGRFLQPALLEKFEAYQRTNRSK